MVGIARFPVARQRPVAEGGVFRAVQHQFVVTAGRQCCKHLAARRRIRVADQRVVLGSGHQQPRDLDSAERRFSAPELRRAGTHHDRRFDTWVRRVQHAEGKALAAHRLCRERAERVPRHADPRQVQPARKRMPRLAVPRGQRIEQRGDIRHTSFEILKAGGAGHRGPARLCRHILPNGFVAARMLREDRDIPACRPMAAEVRVVLARPAQPVAEEHNRRGVRPRRQVDADGQVTRACCVACRQTDRAHARGFGDAQRVVGHLQPGGPA